MGSIGYLLISIVGIAVCLLSGLNEIFPAMMLAIMDNDAPEEEGDCENEGDSDGEADEQAWAQA